MSGVVFILAFIMSFPSCEGDINCLSH